MKEKTILLILLWSLMACGQNEKRIEFHSGDTKLVGYLSSPNQNAPFPVVVVAHSASHGHHNYLLYNHLEREMNQLGIGVFTFDRRGSGESEGQASQSNLEELAKDVLAAIETLKKLDEVNPAKIGIYGISQGGWIGPIANAMATEEVAFMILVSSCGVTPAEQMEYSAVRALQIGDYQNEIIDTAKYLRRITNDYYRSTAHRDSIQSIIDRYKERPWFSEVYLPWRGNLPKDPKSTRWFTEMDFEPAPYFTKMDIPTLLLYAASDRWVPIENSIAVWEKAFQKSGLKQFQITRIYDAGHMMIIDEDENPKDLIISENYTEQLKNWAKANVVN